MKILFTKSFGQYITKYRINKTILIKEYIKIYNSWECHKIWTLKNFTICKWYLLCKEKRLITLIETDSYIIPVIILKKESRKWWNINKNNILKDFWNDFNKIFNDLENGNVIEIINL